MKLHIAAGLIVATVLVGCASQPSTFSEGGTTSAPPARKIAMAGRWVLSAAGGPSCDMQFGRGPGNGTIEPGADCPGDFFTSRQWTLNQRKLAIADYQGQALAQLTYAHGRFTGHSSAGRPLTLTRS